MLDVAEVLRGAERISAFCHENPDGDTLGAALALSMAAERLGKQAEVVCVDPPPPFLAFLPGIERVRRSPALEPDVAVVVDAGELSRIGAVVTEQADWFSRARIVNIDHHVSNPGYGEAVWIDPEAAATCELITLLLPELGRVSREQISALVGVAPYDDDSGDHTGERHIAGGRARVRRALFNAALPAAQRWNSELVALYRRLTSKGKAHKKALIACVRKLLIFANAVLERGMPWTKEPPAKHPTA